MGKRNQEYAAQQNAAVYLTDPLPMRLNTLTNARKSLAKVIRRYNRVQLPDTMYRGLVYGLSVLVSTMKTEADLIQFEERLKALEERTQ